MKQKRRILSAAIAASLSFGMYSCGELVTNKQFEFKVGQVVAPVTIFIEDAKTGKMPSGLTFTTSGKDAAAVIHANNMDAGFVPRNGMLEIGLKPGMMPSEGKPYAFTMVAKAEGYLNGILSVTLTADKRTTATLRMIKISDLPQGVLAAQGSSAAATAAGPREDIRVSTSGPANVPTSNVVVERETAFLGETGEVLTGDVKVLMVQNSGQSTGGSTIRTNDIAGVPGINPGEQVSINPLSNVVSVEMTAGGSRVTNFRNKKPRVSMGISNTAINPETKAAYKAGDMVVALSQNEATGKWMMEGMVPVMKSADGKLWATIETSHLSDFVVTSSSPRRVPTAPRPGTIFANISAAAGAPKGYYWLEAHTATRLLRTEYVNIQPNATLPIITICEDLDEDVTVKLYYRKPTETTKTTLLMGQTTVTKTTSTSLTITLAKPAGFGAPSTANFNLYAYCPGKMDQKILPNTAITFKEKGAAYEMSMLGNMKDGQFTTDMLVVGQTYTFNTHYTGNFDYTVKAENNYSRPLASGEGGVENPCGN